MGEEGEAQLGTHWGEGRGMEEMESDRRIKKKYS